MRTPGPLTKKIKYPLICLMGLILTGIGACFFINRSLPEKEDLQIDSKARLKINGLEQISKRNGITEWTLKSSSAMFLEGKAILTDISVVFHTENNKKIHLSSRKGTLDTQTHDIDFEDDVIITYEAFTFRTDKLHYKKKGHIIYSYAPVRFEEKGTVIEADSILTELNKNKMTLQGNVKGKLSEDFNTM